MPFQKKNKAAKGKGAIQTGSRPVPEYARYSIRMRKDSEEYRRLAYLLSIHKLTIKQFVEMSLDLWSSHPQPSLGTASDRTGSALCRLDRSCNLSDIPAILHNGCSGTASYSIPDRVADVSCATFQLHGLPARTLHISSYPLLIMDGSQIVSPQKYMMA